MANTIVYISAAIAFILIVLLFLIAWIQSSAKQTRILASPTIPRGNAVLTSFASTRISAPTADVFAVLLKYKDYSKWSCFEQYKWQEIDEDGIPRVGSKGSFELIVEGFSRRHLPAELTVLDKEKLMIAERTITYPSWLLGLERVQEIIPVEGHPRLCEYRTWQTLEGFAAYALLLTAQEELAQTQRDTADGLKAYMEKSRATRAKTNFF